MSNSIVKKLSEICTPKQWKTLPFSDLLPTGYPVYGANGKVGFYSSYTHSKVTILITCRGATCGEINICEPYSYVNGNAMALDNLSENVDLNFLAYYLKYRGFSDVISGSAQPQITRQGLDKVTIPNLPLPDQQRIAEILDHADAICRKNREILEKYNQLAQSVFVEMFGDPTKNSMNWETKRFGDNIIDIVAGKSVGGDERKILEGELGVLKISSVTLGVFNSTEYKVIKKDTIKGPIINPKKGDLLFSRANTREMVGATCIVDKTYSNLFLPDKLWRIDLDGNKFQNSYIKYLLSHEGFRNNLRKVATGTSGSMLNISKQKLRDLSVPVPPIDLQRKFGNIIKSIEDSKQNFQQCFDKSEDLFQSLLQRAFRGEL